MLNSLPDDCLLPIFDRVPLVDLLLLDQVCHRWASLQPSALCRRHSLTLLLPDESCSGVNYEYFRIPFTTKVVLDAMPPIFVPPACEQVSALELRNLCVTEPLDWSEQYMDCLDMSVGYLAGLFDASPLDDVAPADLFTEMARLKHARISGQLPQWFMSHFLEIHSLAIVHPSCSEKELLQLIDLLTFWRLTLVGSLKLWLRICIDNIDRFELEGKLASHPALLLFKVIGQLSSLKYQLTLDISSVYAYDEAILGLELPRDIFANVSSQLSIVELYLGTYDVDSSRLNDLVNRLLSSTNPHLRQIGFGDSYDFAALHEQLSTYAPQASYRHICFPHCPNLSWIVNCGRFDSLNLLQIDWEAEISFAQLVSNLAMLSQLSHLVLNVSFPSLPPKPFDLSNNDQIISLPQIKVLSLLNIELYSHLDFQSLSPLVFPSVSVTFVIIDSSLMTTPCQVCRRYIGSDLTFDQKKRCRQLLIRSLNTKLPALRRLYCKFKYGEDNFVDRLSRGQVVIDDDDGLSQIVDDLKAQIPRMYSPFLMDSSQIEQLQEFIKELNELQ